MSVFPHGANPRAAVVPIGEPPQAACEAVAETLRETFDLSVPIRPPIEPPAADDLEEGNVEAYLRALAAETGGVDLAIGVTDRRIRERPRELELFGVGIEFGTVGLVSTARLVEGTGLSALERDRLTTETLSVAGAMLGLRTVFHEDEDDEQPCAVAPGDARFQLDEAPTTYCEDCWTALTDASTYPRPPGPDDWVVRTREQDDPAIVRRWRRGDQRLRDYPLLAVGLVGLAVRTVGRGLRPLVGWLPRPGPGTARKIPRPVHTFYRIARFWTNVVLYLGAVVLWLATIMPVSQLFFESNTVATLAFALVSVVAGVYSVWLLKAIVGGIYDGLRGRPAGNAR